MSMLGKSTQIRVCYIQCFKASEELLSSFIIHKERSGGSYSIKCMLSAFNDESKEAWIYGEFERIRQSVLERALKVYGVSQVNIVSYSPLDYAVAASTALECVLKKSKTLGFKLICLGSPSGYTRKAHDEIHEFDVVKKRRLMTSTTRENIPEGETCPDALLRFEEFESHVLPALVEISRSYQEERFREILQMEEDFNSGATPTQGLIYVAISKAVKFPKIGATRRSDPVPRLRELSRSVPSPFEWVFYVRTATPFKLESAIHLHFDACRIKEKGACTEFFDIDIVSIGAYLKSQFDVVERSCD